MHLALEALQGWIQVIIVMVRFLWRVRSTFGKMIKFSVLQIVVLYQHSLVHWEELHKLKWCPFALEPKMDVRTSTFSAFTAPTKCCTEFSIFCLTNIDSYRQFCKTFFSIIDAKTRKARVVFPCTQSYLCFVLR